MRNTEQDIHRFIEPIFGFCIKRLLNRHDAEDLAGEIMLHVLDGLKKYEINSLEAWVWRIAHNRYARFVQKRRENAEDLTADFPEMLADDYTLIDAVLLQSEYESLFRSLHTLSSDYKNILVDYYIGEMPIGALAKKYALPSSAVKWRLHVSREKMKERIGNNSMDKIYQRINWNTKTCNGARDSNRYLGSQIARAICEAAYEKPATVEEISLATGIPTMYIEDELPRLLEGEAIARHANKYATDFIILRLEDKIKMNEAFYPHLQEVTDYFDRLLAQAEQGLCGMPFYGAAFGLQSLGHIAVPAVIRGKIRRMKEALSLPDGNFPPRRDGGYGWFLVEETESAQENTGKYACGCNVTDEDPDHLYYFWIQQYFCSEIYRDGGMRWLSQNRIPQQCRQGIVPPGLLQEEDAARLLSRNLIEKTGEGYRLNFPVFTQEEYARFLALFEQDSAAIDRYLAALIRSVHQSFCAFTPKRLNSQVNQWVSCYMHGISGMVCERLMQTGRLTQPQGNKPLTDGVFFVEGAELQP